jgi:hypothetical protein
MVATVHLYHGPTCVLDESVLNAETVLEMTNIGLSIFAELCGRNRGFFVAVPNDRSTYSCLTLPPSFATNAGIIADNNVTIANDIGALIR